MRKRGFADGDVPVELLRFDAADWPGVDPPTQQWRSARRRWLAEHPPRSLGDLNRLYGPDVVWPAGVDPRIDVRLTRALAPYDWPSR